MQQIIYVCDNCKKRVKNEHISLPIGYNAGWVKKVSDKNWKFSTAKIPQAIYHFCDDKCIGEFFKKLKDKE